MRQSAVNGSTHRFCSARFSAKLLFRVLVLRCGLFCVGFLPGVDSERTKPVPQRLQRETLSTAPARESELALTRNISQLLENLLANYDNNQRPSQGVRPTQVTANMLIRSMGPISELDMEYSMDCYFRQKWTDHRLRFDGPISPISLHIKMLEGIWKPDTYFHNGKGSYLHTITQPNKLLRISRNGDVLYSMRLTIKARCPMQLQSFPMDRQSCPLAFGSYGYTANQLVYNWDKEVAVDLIPGLALSQFDLINYPYRNSTSVFSNGPFSVLHVNFNLQRHMGYFLIQVYVPCILIVVLSWVSFWINREATADRVGLGITTVLTLSTFGLDTRTDLPKVPYPTSLDWFVIMCFSFVIFTLLEFAGVHYFTKVGSGEFPCTPEEDKGSPNDSDADIREDEVPPEFFIPIHSIEKCVCKMNKECDSIASSSPVSSRYLAYVASIPRHRARRRRYNCCTKFLHCIAGNERFRNEMRSRASKGTVVNSVSQIDRVSRVLFPVSFILINLFYWFSFGRDRPEGWEPADGA